MIADDGSAAGRPRRIQRKRTKGWTMPKGAVYVGRPTIWGNPCETADQFKQWLCGELSGRGLGGLRRLAIIGRAHELRGKTLACWCPLSQPCHADILLELANGK